MTSEVVFVGPAVHCLAYIKSTPLPLLGRERAKQAVHTALDVLLKELGDALVLRGIFNQKAAKIFLTDVIEDYLLDNGLTALRRDH